MVNEQTSPARPGFHEYFMGIALAVRERANCKGNRVGAVLVVGDRVVATGYNGTPEDMENCEEGGCERCANREKYGSGIGYDVCICVHAEQNALLTAARFGIRIEGAVLYSTMRPCFGCTKEALQAKVKSLYYLHDWSHPHADLQSEYEKLQARIPEGVKKVDMEDTRAGWAVSAMRRPEDTGHQGGQT